LCSNYLILGTELFQKWTPKVPDMGFGRLEIFRATLGCAWALFPSFGGARRTPKACLPLSTQGLKFCPTNLIFGLLESFFCRSSSSLQQRLEYLACADAVATVKRMWSVPITLDLSRGAQLRASWAFFLSVALSCFQLGACQVDAPDSSGSSALCGGWVRGVLNHQSTTHCYFGDRDVHAMGTCSANLNDDHRGGVSACVCSK
jgi:hypothetical protein